ncbi:hypothetical protein [Streptomyces gardneri]|uniref:hypothetical protein n=1 Tax=Streptomyces gardneri TaxID=66892 RepID=UPI0036B36652
MNPDEAALLAMLREHAKPYDPTVPSGPRDIVLVEQADGPPRLYLGGVEYAYAAVPSSDGSQGVLELRRLAT